jgi:hypothetical protein
LAASTRKSRDEGRTGQLSQEQLEPQLHVPEDAQPQLPMVKDGVETYPSRYWSRQKRAKAQAMVVVGRVVVKRSGDGFVFS